MSSSVAVEINARNVCHKWKTSDSRESSIGFSCNLCCLSIIVLKSFSDLLAANLDYLSVILINSRTLRSL